MSTADFADQLGEIVARRDQDDMAPTIAALVSHRPGSSTVTPPENARWANQGPKRIPDEKPVGHVR
jgi:hypothetical protein